MRHSKNKKEGNDTICYRRNFGIIEGNFSRLVPFFYIFQHGRITHGIPPVHDRMNGIFGVHNSDKYGTNFYRGVIVPLATCRNEKIKTAVVELKKHVFACASASDDSERRQQAQLIISEVFGDNIRLSGHFSNFSKSIGFKTDSHIIKMLSDNFECLDEIQDCSGGAAVPAKYKPLGAETYGNFMELYHEKANESWWHHFEIALIFEANGDIDDFSFCNDSISRPSTNLLKNFVVNSSAVNCSPLCMSLEQNGQEVFIHLTLGSNRLSISLWNETDRFDPLIAWLKCIEQDDMPVCFEAGKEWDTPYIKMTAYPTNENGRILIHMKGSAGELLNEIVAKDEFLTAFKAAIRQFFLNCFDAKAWYCMHKGVVMPDKFCQVPEPHIGEIVITDPWFMQKALD